MPQLALILPYIVFSTEGLHHPVLCRGVHQIASPVFLYIRCLDEVIGDGVGVMLFLGI